MGTYYTIQHLDMWDISKKGGFLVGDKNFVEKDFIKAYRWMIKQMNLRINHDGTFPIWLYIEQPNLCDDELIDSWYKKGQRVCLTLQIKDEKVLLSDFDAWHCVLNNWFCPLTEDEDVLFEQGKISLTKEESWERIFSLDLIANSEMWSGNQEIQGTTGCIPITQVINVNFF